MDIWPSLPDWRKYLVVLCNVRECLWEVSQEIPTHYDEEIRKEKAKELFDIHVAECHPHLIHAKYTFWTMESK